MRGTSVVDRDEPVSVESPRRTATHALRQCRGTHEWHEYRRRCICPEYFNVYDYKVTIFLRHGQTLASAF